ncbi:MAG: lipid-binding SYLF domain-containing protein [Deltaproteobacteria bacterium]|nr:lipid-binding SYLF domain-containing protein [Deltaproteobacteria bacterium]
MKRLFWVVMIVLVFGMSTVAFGAEIKDYSDTINVFMDSPVVQKFFKNSYGYAVFPTIGKLGWLIGGSYGPGQVYRGGKVTGKTSINEGTIGFQFGGKAFSEIIFFKDKRAYDKFTSGGFEFDATAQAIAITAGAQAKAGSTGVGAGASAGPKTGVQAKTNYVNGMAVFVHSKGGLMYEFSVGGQKFSFEPI